MIKSNLLYINGKDAWLTWSVMLIENSYDNLRKPPAMKEYTSNKFRSQAGKQVFIVNPQPDERQVTVMFGITCDTKEEYLSKYQSFITEINDGILEMQVVPINKTYTLYIEDYIDLSTGLGIMESKLSVRFNEPLSVPVVFDALATESTDLILTEDNKIILV